MIVLNKIDKKLLAKFNSFPNEWCDIIVPLKLKESRGFATHWCTYETFSSNSNKILLNYSFASLSL